ncbi:methyl-accepting chemotaxis protein [Marinomonas sp. 15G1-11]|uniref:Methyl-accepting chemotaxis protein n=1 Tax=Marinomonas phaeophyticola TaxID=3004091 RepID=A0ABT4JSE8_9GAMM|nr:methyl-accepting chemotaxis protein [Marinomonas sp. 15G1-11]MCZ2720524.1 methyl-accepting chemotaxis protein [Marinomonas sp. 15G1-11]
MLSNLSFRSKLIALLASAIVGFVIVTIVALNGLNSQESSAVKLQSLTAVEKNLDSLAIMMMEKYETLKSVDNSNYQEFINDLETNTQNFASTLDNDIKTLETKTGKDLLRNTKNQLDQYSIALIDLVQQRHIIGFDINSGLMGSIETLGATVFEQVSFLSLIKQEFLPVREAEKNYLFDPNDENSETFQTKYDKFFKRVQNFGLEERFGEVINQYYDAVQAFSSQEKKVKSSTAEFNTQRTLFSASRLETGNYIKKVVTEAQNTAKSMSNQASFTLISVSIIVALIAAIMMAGIGKSVNNTLNQIIKDLAKVKGGDLTARLSVNAKRNDEFDALCGSVNEMTTGLGSVVSDVISTTKEVNTMVSNLNTSVNSIAESNKSVSLQTNSLAAATDEISMTISSISSTTDDLSRQSQETYESAKTGAETIKGALSNLGKTVEVVTKTGIQLNELGQLSKDIDNVIGMINDLANQTNLLALNAAIEAARAGEAGRGFSVVADEVRSLAEKTVDATSKITEIVSTIQGSTKNAIETMESGQESLKAIEEYGAKAETAMKDIEENAQTSSISSVDMARSIQEVSKTAVSMSQEMDSIAQQLQGDTESINSIAGNTNHIHDLVTDLDKKTRVFTTN